MIRCYFDALRYAMLMRAQIIAFAHGTMRPYYYVTLVDAICCQRCLRFISEDVVTRCYDVVG